jgi:hypothetical protein
MLTSTIVIEAGEQTLWLADYAGPGHRMLRGEGSHVPRPTGDISADCVLNLETSADSGQAVTMTLEYYAAAEPQPDPGPTWVLDGEGIFPRRSSDPLYAVNELLEWTFFDIDVPVGDHRFEAWVEGREENRAAIAAWQAVRDSPEGRLIPEEASKTVPISLEHWLIRLIAT